jgi:hypothetical protein
MPAGPWEPFWEPDEPAGPVPRRTDPERKLSVTVGPADLSGRPIEAYGLEVRPVPAAYSRSPGRILGDSECVT